MENSITDNIKINRLETFIKDYLLPLIGFTRKEIMNDVIFDKDSEEKNADENNTCRISESEDKTVISFHVDIAKIAITINKILSDDEKAIAGQLSNAYSIAFREQNTSTNSIKYRNTLYKYAVDRGIASWIISNNTDNLEMMDKLFNCLEQWSLKTYEGHKVCFGIIVNNTDEKTQFSSSENGIGNFISFLQEEYAAVLSDGITSVFEIDNECNLIKYSSITENDLIEPTELSNFLPYRFSQTITKFVDSPKKVGIFLLTNGDIILAKNSKIYFIKRNGRWLNFSFDIFKKAVSNSCNISNLLLEKIYGTMIDISLSHGGGIISVVDENNTNWIKDRDIILNDSDILFNNNDFKKMYERENENSRLKNKISDDDNYGLERCKREAQKKVTKKFYLENIIGSDRSFTSLDRKLRCELSCLDGASIIDINGKILSFGAIIQNDSGSQGGGRGAAARKLSNYGGFSVKISTDGYIEVYCNNLNLYSIK